jgi:hypothetical protein
MACEGYDGGWVARSSGARPWSDGDADRKNCRSDRWFKYTEKWKDLVEKQGPHAPPLDFRYDASGHVRPMICRRNVGLIVA